MPASARRGLLPALIVLLACLSHLASAYQVLVSDQDEVRQVCSGMWGKGAQDPFIEVFEWEDAEYLGLSADGQATGNDWSPERVYICTLEAQKAGLCDESKLGQFLTSSLNPSDSSIFTSAVRLDGGASAGQQSTRGPFRYEVKRTGYYCVGTVPLAAEGSSRNTTFTGVVDFENVFGGHLPASEYPKVAFYRILFFVYLAFAGFWASWCWVYRRELLPLQQYITATVVFLVVEQLFVWLYWRFMNNSGHPGVAGAYLFLVSALNAARNSVSLYLLCLASMGLSIVRPSLGGVLPKVRLLALVHFVFGLLYSIGTVTVPLDSAGFFVVFFVVPLSVSLTAFLMWILYSLNSTIAELGARRQTFKRTMFRRLYLVLLSASGLILLFFLASSITFSSRLSPSFPARTWQTRWLLLDGWLSILYAVTFFAIAFLWRPTQANRHLALSDELPLDEAEAELYDLDDEDREDAGELKETYPLRATRTHDERVVFDVGSDDDDDEDENGGPSGHRRQSSAAKHSREFSAGSARSAPGGKPRGAEESRLLDGGEDEDEDLDITSQHGAAKERAALGLSEEAAAPPAYKSSASSYKDD
ncbi:hypothetical protein Rhopal_002542-T1 [Rhodotorula paludigena]|uniref:Lung seven transmembrane receptor-domain-containing protein n=1 Tax=Rhodotorula paludigena TaxID=86838 RepID=A0AAV5GAH6_9BASI|nr:hypothetical protein Rhopal_002542-T1 [Rhodotorula paludigena]